MLNGSHVSCRYTEPPPCFYSNFSRILSSFIFRAANLLFVSISSLAILSFMSFFRLYWWSNSESMQQFCGSIGWRVCWLASLLIILYVYAEANDVARSRHKIGALKSATGTFHPVVTWQARCDTTATYWYLQIILSHCINDPNMTCDDPQGMQPTAMNLEGLVITNGWHECNRVDSVQDAWLALFLRFQSCTYIETYQNGRRAIEMFDDFDARIKMDRNRSKWSK